MAIVVGDVVELGLSAPGGEISKILGIVEGESGDQIQVFTGVPPVLHREVPRLSVRRVWPAASAQWEITDYNNFNVSYTNLGKRMEKRKGSASSQANGEDGSEAGERLNVVHPIVRSRTVNPLRWLCGSLDAIREWRSPPLTMVVMSCLSAWTAIECHKFFSRPASIPISLFFLESLVIFLLVVSISISVPSAHDPSPLWLYGILAVLTMYAIFPGLCAQLLLTVLFVTSCMYGKHQ